MHPALALSLIGSIVYVLVFMSIDSLMPQEADLQQLGALASALVVMILYLKEEHISARSVIHVFILWITCGVVAVMFSVGRVPEVTPAIPARQVLLIFGGFPVVALLSAARAASRESRKSFWLFLFGLIPVIGVPITSFLALTVCSRRAHRRMSKAVTSHRIRVLRI